MCGIAGQYNFIRREPVEPDTIRRMIESIRHRGPDDEGYFFEGAIGLGFRRLSIIDLAGGHQPMADGEATVLMIFSCGFLHYKALGGALVGSGSGRRATFG